jgi:hypothetical protein
LFAWIILTEPAMPNTVLGTFDIPNASHSKFVVLRNEVKVFFVQALGSQVVLVIGNAFQNID